MSPLFAVRNGGQNQSFHQRLWNWREKWPEKRLLPRNIFLSDLTAGKWQHQGNQACLCQEKTYLWAVKLLIERIARRYSEVHSREPWDMIHSTRKMICVSHIWVTYIWTLYQLFESHTVWYQYSISVLGDIKDTFPIPKNLGKLDSTLSCAIKIIKLMIGTQ